MEIGIRVPSYARPGMSREDSHALRTYARRAEDLGFDALWVVEHLLVAPEIYGTSWLDPLQVLAFLSACTERVRLGTAILVLPFRHPVVLAKEVASLSVLSGERLVVGVGPGWYEKEFAAVGVPMTERGRRTDEALRVLRLLLTGPQVSFDGEFVHFEDVTIEPRPSSIPKFWVAGGSSTDPSQRTPAMHQAVLRRIVAADGWLAGSSGRHPAEVLRDWDTIRRFAGSNGRDPDSLIFAQTQFLHIVDTADRARAIEEQVPEFLRVMGAHRDLAELQACYLFGTVDDMLERLRVLKQAGLRHLVLTPLTSDVNQLELIKRHLAPELRAL